jgi:hypothetical protein
MALPLTRSTVETNERVGVTRKDGTRVAGRVTSWEPTEVKVLRHNGRVTTIKAQDVDSVISFDR